MEKKPLNSNPNVDRITKNLLNESLDALDVGLDFFQQHLKNEDNKKLKIAILQFQRFIEYIIKYFVSEFTPLLVYTDIFEKQIKLENAKSISLTQAINFYINHLAFGLININRQYDHIELKEYLVSFNKLRNKINHWFVEPFELDDIHLSSLFQIIYLVCLDHKLEEKINSSLSKDKQELLKKFTTEEWRKLRLAYKKVDEYIKSRSSSDPKEYNENDAPVFFCQQCGEQTLILSEDNDKFICPNCECEEGLGTCSVNLACAGGNIPDCYLSEWNTDEEGCKDMICDDCYDEFESRVRKE